MKEWTGPRAISVEGSDELTKDSVEIARIWITNHAGSTIWIDASALENPRIFGYLMSDTVRHAARAYASTWGLDEAAALQEIVEGLSEELREQFGEITTLQKGSLD
jgi:Domain of unknown function (DUF5076)